MPSSAPTHSEQGEGKRASLRSTPLVNPSPLASYQAQQVFLVNHSAALHSDSLVNKWVYLSSTAAAFRSHLPISYSVSARGNEKVLCLSTWASSCVSSDTVYCLRTAWQRRHPKRSSSPEAAPRSQAQQREAGGLLSLFQAACWETSGDTGKTTRPTCTSWLTRLSAASTPGPQLKGKTTAEAAGSLQHNFPLVDRICR